MTSPRNADACGFAAVGQVVRATLLCVAIAGPAVAQQNQNQSQNQPQPATPLQAPVALQGGGPFYRLVLPNAIHARSAFEDLRDLRVRNAAGRPVPFAWLDAEADTVAPRMASRHAPMFAVPVSARSDTTGADASTLGLKLRPDGSVALGMLPSARSAAPAVTDWVIDATQVDGALVQVRFELDPAARGLFTFALEGSDDLRQWRPLGGDEQLVRLLQAGQSLERLAVEIDHVRTRYLRLRWRDPARAPRLTGVWLDSVQEAEPVAALTWSPEIGPASCSVDHCDYPVPRGLPVESVRIALADPNTLAAVQILTVPTAAPRSPRPPPRNALYVLRHGRPHRPADPTQALALVDTVVYRLAQPGGEARSGAIALDGSTHTTLRLRSDGGIAALGATAPRLSFGARPRTIVFLAQGQPPFALSWNAAGDPMPRGLAGPLALTSLIPGHRWGETIAVDSASVALPALAVPIGVPVGVPVGASSAALADATPAGRKAWLWAALGGGLLLLGAMASSLLRGLKHDASR